MIWVRSISRSAPLRKHSDTDQKPYFAGFMDAKANFAINMIRYKTRRYTQIEAVVIVYGNNTRPLKLVQEFYGGTISIADRREAGGKAVYRLQIKYKQDVVNMIKDILPYLKIKRKNAELLLRYCESRLKSMEEGRFARITDEERRIAKELVALNKQVPQD